VVFAAASVACAALSACSSSAGSSPSGGGSAAGAGDSVATSACVSKASAAVTAATAPMHPPTPSAVDVGSKLAGKTIWDIEFNSSVPISNSIATGLSDAAAAVGVKVKNFDGKGQVAQWNQGVSEAVSQHAAAILLLGFVPDLVKTPFEAAVKAHIPVIDTLNGNPTDPLNGLFAHVTGQVSDFGKTMADLALKQTNCKADIAIFTGTVLQTLVDQDKGAQDEVKALCGSACKTTLENVEPASIPTATGPLTQNAVRRDPKINFIIAQSDALALYVVPALAQVNSKVPVVSQTGSQANLAFVKDGKQYADLAFPDNKFIGWQVMDEMVRALTGAPASQEAIPAQLLIHGDNFDPNNPFPSFGDYQAQFKKLWSASA
jgi:ABC-type sugar transport system substrate-binding protein